MEINLKDYLDEKTARFIGVSEGTLRNWGREGKIRTHRHPINGYRLYRKADLDALLTAVHHSRRWRRRRRARVRRDDLERVP